MVVAKDTQDLGERECMYRIKFSGNNDSMLLDKANLGAAPGGSVVISHTST